MPSAAWCKIAFRGIIDWWFRSCRLIKSYWDSEKKDLALCFWTLGVAVSTADGIEYLISILTMFNGDFGHTWTVGNDVRKAVADGFPVKQVLTSDLRPGKWHHFSGGCYRYLLGSYRVLGARVPAVQRQQRNIPRHIHRRRYLWPKLPERQVGSNRPKFRNTRPVVFDKSDTPRGTSLCDPYVIVVPPVRRRTTSRACSQSGVTSILGTRIDNFRNPCRCRREGAQEVCNYQEDDVLP